jgi:hypothetical protein
VISPLVGLTLSLPVAGSGRWSAAVEFGTRDEQAP